MGWRRVENEGAAASLELRTILRKRRELASLPSTQASEQEKAVINAGRGRGFAILQPRN